MGVGTVGFAGGYPDCSSALGSSFMKGGGSGGSGPPSQKGGDLLVRDALLLGLPHGLAQVDAQEVLALGGANRQTVTRQSPDRQTVTRQTDRQTDSHQTDRQTDSHQTDRQGLMKQSMESRSVLIACLF